MDYAGCVVLKAVVKKIDTANKIRQSLLSRVIAALCLICIVSVPVALFAQTLPKLLDRTSESLQGLPNDTTDKSLELGDFNSDGLEDLLVVRKGADPVLLINESSVLTNRTVEYLPQSGEAANSNYAESFDANADGLNDLVFARLGRSPLLYMNQGNDSQGSWLGFDNPVDIPEANDSLVIESGDINDDGLADLFIIQVELATNKLLINNGDGQFVDETVRLGELADLQRGHSAMLADVDGDNDADIIYIESDLFLHVYYNDGSGTYSNSLRHTFQNSDKFAYIFGAADFNGDGIFDYRQYSNTAPMAQMSVGIIDGSRMPVYLQRQDEPMQRGNRKHGTVHMRDIDADGDIDYVLSSMMRNFGGLSNTFEGMRTEIVLNSGFNSGEFITFTGDDWGRQESMDMKILDVNNDGNMDMFVAHQNRYAVYLNGAPIQLVELQSLTGQAQQAGLATTFNAQLSSGSNVQYEWDFGDGTIVNTDQRSVTHVYAQPGRYLVSLTATSSQGSDQITYTQRVHEPLLAGATQSSSSIALQAVPGAADRVWVANPDHDSVTVLDAESGAKLAETAVCQEPHGIAVASDDIVLVTCKGSAELVAISTSTFVPGARLAFQYGSMPHGVVVDRDAGLAYVVLQAAGELVKVQVPDSTNQAEVLARLDVGPAPRHLALAADGNSVFVSRFITRPVAGESSANVATTGGGEVLAINASLMQRWSTALLGYNDVQDGDDRARGIPNYLTAPAIAPHGTTAVVGAKLDNIYRGTLRDGNSREHNMLVRSIASTISLVDFRENTAARIDFDNNSPPSALAFGPGGNLLFVIHEGSRLLEIVDVYRGDTVFSTTVGFAPKGLVLSDDGRQLYVHNYLSRDVSFFDTSQLIDGQSDNAVLVRTVSTVSNEALSAQVLLGKQLFHDAADAALTGQKYLSCAVCHSEMGHDGRTWDFSDAGEGLRNTIDLRGHGGMAHGNIHWTANFDEIHDFENDIREIFKGSGLLTDGDYERTSGILDEQNPKAGLNPRLDALSAFVNTLTEFPASPHRSETGSLTEAAQRGHQVFRRYNCGTCHSGQPFTDSPSGVFHNIGTVDAATGNRLGLPLPGNGLDTPTLRGLWLTAPYLHDGSALTLQDAVRAHRRLPAYASIARISGSQMNDLVAYLMQIDDAEPVSTSSLDNDGDLILNEFDDDDDNDGVPDSIDALPFDASESADNDGDKIGDNADPDDDNDGIADELEGEFTNSDSDDVIDRFDLDSDNDTIPDVVEADGAIADADGRIDTPGQLITQPPDTDGDGIYDFRDIRSNSAANDSGEFDIAASAFVAYDINQDGVVDALDGAVDNDNDGADDRILSSVSVGVGGGCALASDSAAADPTLVLIFLALLMQVLRRQIMTIVTQTKWRNSHSQD